MMYTLGILLLGIMLGFVVGVGYVRAELRALEQQTRRGLYANSIH